MEFLNLSNLQYYDGKIKNYIDTANSAIQTQLNEKASSTHKHSGTDINSGTINVAQLPAYQGATSSANGGSGLVPAAQSSERDKFLKGDGTWAVVSTAKEVGYTTSTPTVQSVAALDNEGIVFCESGNANTMAIPVTTEGNQVISGVKTFINGLYGGVITLASDESAFDLSRATAFIKTVSTDTTFSFTNVPVDVVCCITVLLINGGNYIVTWPSKVKWTGNATPVLTQNGKDVLTFITFDSGNTWFGTTTCIGVTA